MTQQLTTTSSSEVDERGIDRRKFLLRTTAVTAGAWAAPSILTIDRAFGAPGSPNGCPCEPAETDAATVKGTVTLLNQVPLVVRENACLNDDTIATIIGLPAGLGTVQLLQVSCDCGARVSVGDVLVNTPGGPTIAQALQSNAACDCRGGTTGGSRVVGLTAFGEGVVDSTAPQVIPIPGGLGFIILNEVVSPAPDGGTEYNALHIVYTDPLGTSVDLKFASSRVEC